MIRLTKYEKETIILTNEEDDFWNVFTYNKGLQRRLCPLLNNIQKMSIQEPE